MDCNCSCLVLAWWFVAEWVVLHCIAKGSSTEPDSEEANWQAQYWGSPIGVILHLNQTVISHSGSHRFWFQLQASLVRVNIFRSQFMGKFFKLGFSLQMRFVWTNSWDTVQVLKEKKIYFFCSMVFPHRGFHLFSPLSKMFFCLGQSQICVLANRAADLDATSSC